MVFQTNKSVDTLYKETVDLSDIQLCFNIINDKEVCLIIWDCLYFQTLI